MNRQETQKEVRVWLHKENEYSIENLLVQNQIKEVAQKTIKIVSIYWYDEKWKLTPLLNEDVVNFEMKQVTSVVKALVGHYTNNLWYKNVKSRVEEKYVN